MSKILELITSVQLGGAENVAFAVAEACSQPGRELVVVELFRSNDDYAQSKRKELESKGIRIVTLSLKRKRWALLEAPWRLAALIRRESPEIIHSHTDLPDFVLSVALRLLKLAGVRSPKVMRTIHNVELWPTHPGLGRITERGLSDVAVLGVSCAALEAYRAIRSRYGLSLAPECAVVYNGVLPTSPKAVPFPMEPDVIHVGYCGRFDHQKGVDVLVERIQAVQSRWAGRFVFHLMGDGPLREMMESLARQCAGVCFHGPLQGAASYLHAFDGIADAKFDLSSLGGVVNKYVIEKFLHDTMVRSYCKYYVISCNGAE